MIYQGNDVYEFINNIKISKDDIKYILEEIYTSKDYNFKDEITKLISDFEDVYTEEEFYRKLDRLDTSDEYYQQGYEQGHEDGYNEGYEDGYIEAEGNREHIYIDNINELKG